MIYYDVATLQSIEQSSVGNLEKRVRRKTMKAITVCLVVTLVLVASTASAQANGYAGYQAVYEKNQTPKHNLELYLEKPAWGKVGVSAFTFVTSGWAEAYAGPTYAPSSWLTAGVSLGAQQTNNELGIRYASSLWMGGGKVQFLGFVEGDNSVARDASGFWYDAKAVYSPLPRLSLGLHGRRFVGIGPRVEVKLPTPSLPVTLWGTWNPYDPESRNQHMSAMRGVVGAKAQF